MEWLDFFNISGSLFIEREAPITMRASAQGFYDHDEWSWGLAWGIGSGLAADHFTVNGVRNWPAIWFTFAVYALVWGLIFPFAFRYRHKRGEVLVVATH